MTDKNADVEWLRATFGGYLPPEFNAFATREVYFMQMRRLLAHIDRLEAGKKESVAPFTFRREDVDVCAMALSELIAAAIDRAHATRPRPTVHEIAAQIMAGMFSNGFRPGDSGEAAHYAYNAAEALVAEGRRRDGLL